MFVDRSSEKRSWNDLQTVDLLGRNNSYQVCKIILSKIDWLFRLSILFEPAQVLVFECVSLHCYRCSLCLTEKSSLKSCKFRLISHSFRSHSIHRLSCMVLTKNNSRWEKLSGHHWMCPCDVGWKRSVPSDGWACFCSVSSGCCSPIYTYWWASCCYCSIVGVSAQVIALFPNQIFGGLLSKTFCLIYGAFIYYDRKAGVNGGRGQGWVPTIINVK